MEHAEGCGGGETQGRKMRTVIHRVFCAAFVTTVLMGCVDDGPFFRGGGDGSATVYVGDTTDSGVDTGDSQHRDTDTAPEDPEVSPEFD